MRAFRGLWQRLSGLSLRSRAIGIYAATSLGARTIGIGCQLLQVPIAVGAMGAESFGLWMTLTSVMYLITFADFGVGQGAQNRMAEAFAGGRIEAARDILATSWCFLAVIAVVIGGLGALVVSVVDVARIFHLSGPTAAEAHGAVVAVLVIFCLGFPMGLAQRLAHSRQRGWMFNVAQTAGAVVGLGGLALAVGRGWSLGGVILAAQGPMVVANALLLGMQVRRVGAQGMRPRIGVFRDVFGLGAFFGIQQVLVTFLIAVPSILIATMVGAAAVTPFNVAQRLFNLFGVVQNSFMLPLWPAYSDAKARGDTEWIRRTLRLSLGGTVGLTIVPMAIGAALAEPILKAWVGGGTALPGVGLVWMLFAWNAVVFLQQPFGYLLAGLSVVKRPTAYAAVSAVLCAVLMVVFGGHWGVEGVVLGMLVGYVPINLLGNILETRRVLRGEEDGSPFGAPSIVGGSA